MYHKMYTVTRDTAWLMMTLNALCITFQNSTVSSPIGHGISLQCEPRRRLPFFLVHLWHVILHGSSAFARRYHCVCLDFIISRFFDIVFVSRTFFCTTTQARANRLEARDHGIIIFTPETINAPVLIVARPIILIRKTAQ